MSDPPGTNPARIGQLLDTRYDFALRPSRGLLVGETDLVRVSVRSVVIRRARAELGPPEQRRACRHPTGHVRHVDPNPALPPHAPATARRRRLAVGVGVGGVAHGTAVRGGFLVEEGARGTGPRVGGEGDARHGCRDARGVGGAPVCADQGRCQPSTPVGAVSRCRIMCPRFTSGSMPGGLCLCKRVGSRVSRGTRLLAARMQGRQSAAGWLAGIQNLCQRPPEHEDKQKARWRVTTPGNSKERASSMSRVEALSMEITSRCVQSIRSSSASGSGGGSSDHDSIVG